MFFFHSNNTPVVNLPEQVSDLSISQVEDNLILNWSAPDSASNTYKMFRSEDGTSFLQVAVTAIGEIQYVDSGLGQNSEKEYWYYVVANNGIDGLTSSIVNMKTWFVWNTEVFRASSSGQGNISHIELRLLENNGDVPCFIFPNDERVNIEKLDNGSWLPSYDYPTQTTNPVPLKVLVPSERMEEVIISTHHAFDVGGDLDLSYFDADRLIFDCRGVDSLTLPNSLENLVYLQILRYNFTGNLLPTLSLNNNSGSLDVLIISESDANQTFDLSLLNFGGELDLRSSKFVFPSNNSNDFNEILLLDLQDNGNVLDFGDNFTGDINASRVEVRNSVLSYFRISNPSIFNTNQLRLENNVFTSEENLEIAFNSICPNTRIIVPDGEDYDVIFNDGNFNTSLYVRTTSWGSQLIFNSINPNDFNSFIIKISDGSYDFSGFTGSFSGAYFEIESPANSFNSIINYPPNMGVLDKFVFTNNNNGLSFDSLFSLAFDNRFGTDLIARDIEFIQMRSVDQNNVESIIDDITLNIAYFPLGVKTLQFSGGDSGVLNYFNNSSLIKAQSLVDNHDYTITYWDGTQLLTLS